MLLLLWKNIAVIPLIDLSEIPRPRLSYVAGSRAREAVHLYAERSTAADLERIMGRSHKKDTALDYMPAAAPAMPPSATKTPVALER
jgi:hypothetical protein